MLIYLLIAAIGVGALWYVQTQDQAPAWMGAGDGSAPLDQVATTGGTGAPAMAPGDVLPLVQQSIATHGSDFTPAQVMAFLQIESSFRPGAFLNDRNGGSYGLGQLDYSTARDRGYTGDPTGLYDPATNIHYTVAQLDWIKRYLTTAHGGVTPDLSEIAAAYNQGVGATIQGRQDLPYVNKFVAALDHWASTLIG